MPDIALFSPSGPDHVPLNLFPSRCNSIDASIPAASLEYRISHEPAASDPFFTFCGAVGVIRTFEKYDSWSV
jgi:hypothetical protein